MKWLAKYFTCNFIASKISSKIVKNAERKIARIKYIKQNNGADVKCF